MSSDQLAGTRLHVYPREGARGQPHVHDVVAVIQTTANETDGLDVTSRPLPGFPGGLLVMMNSGPRTFQMYSRNSVAAAIDASPRPDGTTLP